MAFTLDDIGRLVRERPGTLVAVASGLVLLAVLGLEHLGGYAPCELCLKERIAYYAALPGSLLALYAARRGWAGAALALFALIGLGFLGNAGLGVHHAGVEWGLWKGPAACTGGSGVATNAGDLLNSLGKNTVVRCDKPALTILGLSLAAWNVPLSLAMAALAGLAARR